jgi:transcriptional regulator with XRE-family HTH domain
MVSGRKPNVERRILVLDLRDQGVSLAEIGRRLGVRRQAVYQIVKAAEKAGRWTVSCHDCHKLIASAGAVPRDDGVSLCLLCLAKRKKATFGQRLRTFRLALGFTRRELCQAAGLQFSSVQHYEEDRKKPHLASREKLALALGLPLEVLTGEEADSSEPEPEA